jgi:2-oxoglutarate ferredoxin oxidoreductase subunit gamma
MVRRFPLGVFRDGHQLDLGHPRRRVEPELDKIPQLLDLDGGSDSTERADSERRIPETRIKVAGFGGQGVILLGTLLAQAGLADGRRVSWIPSYGPEMRGGTANCSVTLSDEEIGTPLVEHPGILVALNGPSLERFGRDVVPGGTIVVNSSMTTAPFERKDVTLVSVAASAIADRLGAPKVANMVMVGALLASGCPVSRESVLSSLSAVVSAGPELIALNRQALEAGYEAAGGPL